MTFSKVSIVLGSYNREQFLKKTIKSIRNNNFNREYEIIVVDGGSSDGSLDYLVKQKDIITIIQHNHGTWQGKTLKRKSWGYFMNLAFKSASGKYICMVSDDCILPENLIENGLLEFDKQQGGNKIIGGIAFYFRDWPLERKYKVHYTYGDRLAINHGIYSKQALEDVGYIDEEEFQFYSADGDLSLRIWDKGYTIIKSKNCFIEHHAHAPARMTHSKKNQYEKDIAAGKKRWKKLIESTGKLGYWEEVDILDKKNTVRYFPDGSKKAIMKSKIRSIKTIIKKYLNA